MLAPTRDTRQHPIRARVWERAVRVIAAINAQESMRASGRERKKILAGGNNVCRDQEVQGELAAVLSELSGHWAGQGKNTAR